MVFGVKQKNSFSIIKSISAAPTKQTDAASPSFLTLGCGMFLNIDELHRVNSRYMSFMNVDVFVPEKVEVVFHLFTMLVSAHPSKLTNCSACLFSDPLAKIAILTCIFVSCSSNSSCA